MYKNTQTNGFTIVELVIVIVVIAILAAISIVAYNGIQNRTARSSVTATLRDAAQFMRTTEIQDGAYPAQIPSGLTYSDKISLRLVGGGGVRYENMTTSQNAVLFIDTCEALIDEGRGRVGTDVYIEWCRVYNKDGFHVNGWNGGDILKPVTVSSLSNYVNSYSGGRTEDFRAHAGVFMEELSARFQGAGGSFPVTQFWDNWATPTNGGVMKPALPTPVSTGGDSSSFCIEATYSNTDILEHVRQDGVVSNGGC